MKILIVFLLLIPCLFFAKDVYAEYYPFTSIIDESDPTKEISYSAIDHTFVDGNKESLKNRVFVVKTDKFRLPGGKEIPPKELEEIELK